MPQWIFALFTIQQPWMVVLGIQSQILRNMYTACTIQVWVSYAFLLIAQLSTLAVALYHDYRLPVKWTYVLWAIYTCFLICAISIELSVDEDTG